MWKVSRGSSPFYYRGENFRELKWACPLCHDWFLRVTLQRKLLHRTLLVPLQFR